MLPRSLLAISLCLGLAACSSLGSGSLETFRLALVGNKLVIDESRLAAGFAYARAEIGKSKLLIGRGQVSDNGRETWYTAGNQILIFEHGLLVGTAGMPLDLIDIRYPEPHPLTKGLHGLSLPAEFSREVDRPDQYREISRYQLEDCGRKNLRTWNISGPVRCLRETLLGSNVSNPLPGNTYWIAEGTGEWRQTRQWIDADWPVLLQPRPGHVDPLVPYKVMASQDSAPSRLVVQAPVRLSQFLLDYPLPAARRPVAAWLSRSTEHPQHQQKRGVQFDLEQALQTKEGMGVEARRRMVLFQSQVAVMPVTGRKPLPVLEPRWLAINPSHDKVLEVGDRLLRQPVPPVFAQVVGNVPAPCRRAVDASITVVALLKACLPGESWPDTIYLVDPAGVVSPVDVALWNRVERRVPPGSLIYVPFHGYAIRSGNPRADADMAEWLATQFDLADAPEAEPPP